MRLVLLTLLLLLTACEREHHPSQFKTQCADVDGDAAAECMIRCAEAANPKSDEEGEDLVAECAEQCSEMKCHTRARYYYWSAWRSCRVAPPEAKRRCDLHFGGPE